MTTSKSKVFALVLLAAALTVSGNLVRAPRCCMIGVKSCAEPKADEPSTTNVAAPERAEAIKTDTSRERSDTTDW
jgi:hypothetical protein